MLRLCKKIKSLILIDTEMGGLLMSKTSAKVKNRWNEKAYDRINLTVEKGKKEIIRECAKQNDESVNGFINRAIDELLQK